MHYVIMLLMENCKLGIYIRISTADQNSSLQWDELTGYAKQRGWTDYKVYEDKCSGRTSQRAAYQKLIQDARTGKVNVILFWKLDRFGRSLKTLLNIFDELTCIGVAFISLKDGIDVTSASGKLLVHLLGAFSEFESNLLRERVRSGIEARKRRGLPHGRPRLIDEARASLLREKGFSLSQIAKVLNVSKSTVHKTLKKKGL